MLSIQSHTPDLRFELVEVGGIVLIEEASKTSYNVYVIESRAHQVVVAWMKRFPIGFRCWRQDSPKRLDTYVSQHRSEKDYNSRFNPETQQVLINVLPEYLAERMVNPVLHTKPQLTIHLGGKG